MSFMDITDVFGELAVVFLEAVRGPITYGILRLSATVMAGSILLMLCIIRS